MSTPHAQQSALPVHGLLCSSVLGPTGEYLGYVYDLAVRPRVGHHPLVTGLLTCIGHYEAFLPASAVARWQRDAVHLDTTPGMRPLEDRGNLLLLRADLFDLWVTGPGGTRGARIRELCLQHSPEGWVLTTSDSRARLVRRLGRDYRDGLLDPPGSPATEVDRHSRVG